MKKIKFLIRIVCFVVMIVAFIYGGIVAFLPIENSEGMSVMSIKWYFFIHYWYIWTLMALGAFGTVLTTD